MKPNFFVVGAQKAATTYLHNVLVQHPEIYLPKQKETKFFIKDALYRNGMSFYESQYFSDWKGESAIGEIDPDYIYFEKALDRIRYNLDVAGIKFIFILRDPVQRAFSHYLMTYRRGLEDLTFKDAIEKERERTLFADDETVSNYSYVDRGFYLNQINKFLSHIDVDQCLFLITEELRDNPLFWINEVYQFLDVSCEHVPQEVNRKYHAATIPYSMNFLRLIKEESALKKAVRMAIPFEGLRHRLRTKLIKINESKKPNVVFEIAVRERLTEFYKEENKRLSEFLGNSLVDWAGYEPRA